MNGISIKEGSSVVESHKAIPPGIIYHHIISYISPATTVVPLIKGHLQRKTQLSHSYIYQ